MDDPFQEKYLYENLTKTNDSPSGKYRVIIKFYNLIPLMYSTYNSWVFIERLSDNSVIYDQKIRGHPKYNNGANGFLTIHGEEWVWIFTNGFKILMNLDRNMLVSIDGCNTYIMLGVGLSPDENTIVLRSTNFYEGEIISFYDISSSPNLLPFLEVSNN